MGIKSVPWIRPLAACGAALALTGAAGCAANRDPAQKRDPAPVPRAAQPTPSQHAMTQVFDAIHRRYRHEIVGVCMGAIDQRTRAVKCYGHVSRTSSGRPNPNTLFQIGSISKTFTATLLALRVQSGAIRLSDPLRRYIPPADGSGKVNRSITLLEVANHYSGLPREGPIDNSRDIPNVDAYLRMVSQCETTPGCPVRPGDHYEYSNFAYGVLGEALGLHDGYPQSSYSAWERDDNANITGPLGMSRTRSGRGWQAFSPSVFDTSRARALEGDPPHEPVPPFFRPAPYADSAAGLYSSSVDMLTWLSYSMGLTGTPALNAARPLLYDTPQLTRPREDPSDPSRKIALAWRIDVNGSGHSKTTCISKNGESRGFTAHMVFVRHRPLGAFVMFNSIPDSGSAAITTDLINSLQALPGGAHPHRYCVTS